MSPSVPTHMQAVVLEKPGQLRVTECAVPTPGFNEILVKVLACGVCRTDLHLFDGELPQAIYPIIPGHQVVGRVVDLGEGVSSELFGQRVGIPWLGSTCGHCDYCQHGQENLCDNAKFTGCHLNGGYADYCLAQADYVLPIPTEYTDTAVAPLLCAGLIGYRAYQKAKHRNNIGFYGFGASAHILIQVAKQQNIAVFVFTREGDFKTQEFAMRMGATWAGSSEVLPPELLDAAIVFASDGTVIPKALLALKKGGRIVCAGIHMSDIPSFDYERLWGERSIESVANLTREDGRGFMQWATEHKIHTTIHIYDLKDAQIALLDLRNGRYDGAYVIASK